MTQVSPYVQALVEGVCGKSDLEIDKVVYHPDGRKVQITGGQFWGEHGLSNFWYWREVLPDGSLSKHEESGYGW